MDTCETCRFHRPNEPVEVPPMPKPISMGWLPFGGYDAVQHGIDSNRRIRALRWNHESRCTRWPKWETVTAGHFCGEHKPKGGDNGQ